MENSNSRNRPDSSPRGYQARRVFPNSHINIAHRLKTFIALSTFLKIKVQTLVQAERLSKEVC